MDKWASHHRAKADYIGNYTGNYIADYFARAHRRHSCDAQVRSQNGADEDYDLEPDPDTDTRGAWTEEPLFADCERDYNRRVSTNVRLWSRCTLGSISLHLQTDRAEHGSRVHCGGVLGQWVERGGWPITGLWKVCLPPCTDRGIP